MLSEAENKIGPIAQTTGPALKSWSKTVPRPPALTNATCERRDQIIPNSSGNGGGSASGRGLVSDALGAPQNILVCGRTG